MQTIELIGDKSVVKFDVETLPATEFIEFQGQRYAPKDEKREVWERANGDPVDGQVFVLDAPKVAGPSPTPTEGEPNAEPDHAETV